MKRIIAWIVLIVSLLGCLAGCKQPTVGEKVAIPKLKVQCGTESVETMRGETYWAYLIDEEEKEWEEIVEEDIHPLRNKDKLPSLTYSESDLTVTMDFEIEPIDIAIVRWDIDAFGDIMADAETVEWDGNTFVLSKDESIYEISARWFTDEGNQIQGRINYCFYTQKR